MKIKTNIDKRNGDTRIFISITTNNSDVKCLVEVDKNIKAKDCLKALEGINSVENKIWDIINENNLS